jgi:hypothetical protein
MSRIAARILVFLFAVQGCGGKTQDAPESDSGGIADSGGIETTGGDAAPESSPLDSGSDVSIVDGPDAPTGCNVLGNSAPVIHISFVASDIPAPKGGAIKDGTYFETASISYTGVGGKTGDGNITQRATATISGSRISLVQAIATDPEEHFDGTLTPSGTTPNFTVTCPMTLNTSWTGFDAAGAQLVLYDADHKRSLVLTRQ